MRYTLITYLFFSCLITHSQSNANLQIIDNAKYIVTYNYSCQEDSNNIKSIRQTEMCLFIGNKVSIYEHNSRYTRDSLWVNCTLEGKAKTQYILNESTKNPYHMLAQYKIIKQNSSTQINFYERILGNYYHIKEDVNLKWELLNSPEDLISGYICKQAQTTYRGRIYRVWYALTIPINDGPYKFRGLPGLIVKLEDTQKQHCFQLINFEKCEYDKPIYFNSRTYTSVAIDKYPKLKSNERLSRAGRITNQVQNISSSESNTIQNKIAQRNNIIERY